MAKTGISDIRSLLDARFGDGSSNAAVDLPNVLLTSIAARGSCRAFTDQPVSTELLGTLAAVALASPTKSDLQQRDIVFLTTQQKRSQLAALVGGQTWVAGAPIIAIFCGNNRRQRMLHEWRNVPFANDHLDAFFNASVDAAVALGAFVTAAEASGLGCCPISAVRNDAVSVSKLIDLPQYVFPIAGLAIGYPSTAPIQSMRLPLEQTVHYDRYAEDGLQDAIEDYDKRRLAAQPYIAQRYPQAFGTSQSYTWSEDKVRQYSRPERETFGAFVRAQGFNLD